MSDYVTKTNVLSALGRFHENDKAMFAKKDTSAVSGNVAKLDASGNPIDSGLPADNVAQKDGYYETLGAGIASNLNTSKTYNDKFPYAYRGTASGGEEFEVGNREEDVVVGGSLVWSQGAPALTSLSKFVQYIDNSVFSNDADGNLVSTYNTGTGINTGFLYDTIKSHIYFLHLKISGSRNMLAFKLRFHSGSTTQSVGGSPISTTPQSYDFFVKKVYNNATVSIEVPNATTTGDYTTIYELQIFDVTTLCGQNIAEKLNDGTISNGGAWLRNFLLKKKFYPQKKNSVFESVCVSAHKMTGFNQYNNATGTARILANRDYRIKGTYSSLAFADLNGNALSITPDADGIFSSDVECVLTVTGGNATDTCVYIYYDETRDDYFEKYEEFNYPLDSSETLRGFLYLDSNNNPYFDGDIYKSNGSLEQVCDEYIFSNDDEWRYNSTYKVFYMTTPSNILMPATNGKTPIIRTSLPYTVTTVNGLRYDLSGIDFAISLGSVSGSDIVIRDDSCNGDIQTLKNKIAGHSLLYKFMNHVNKQAQPYTNPQVCDNWGTEQYVDYKYEQGQRDFEFPCGHDTTYKANPRDFIESLPPLPKLDGLYWLKVENGKASYVSNPLPLAGTTDGTYVLKATVSGGVASYAWVEEAQS